MNEQYIPSFFKQLLHPIDPNDFFENYWDKKHLHIRRDDISYFQNKLTQEDIDNYLKYNELQLPSLELIHQGRTPAHAFSKEKIQRNHYQGKIVDKQKLQDLFSEGHSILINHFGRFAPVFHQAIDELKAFFKAKITEYVVISNAQLDAFRIHHDTEQVFAFQISGEKEWKIYDYLAKNIRTNEVEGRLNPPASDTIVMKPGDLIYIPSCLRHSTRTVSEEPSISVSIAVNQFYGTQILQEVLKYGFVEQPLLNSMLPHPLSDESEVDDYLQNIKEAFVEYLDTVDIKSIVEQIHNQTISKEYNLIEKISELTLESTVEKITTVKPIVVKDGKVIRFRFKHHVLTFFQTYLFTFQFLEKQDKPFQIKNLFGMIDDDARLKLVKQLIRIGYLKKS